ncbi:MAG: hypothetical protein R3A48_18145 [Polyangiales bacterium]
MRILAAVRTRADLARAAAALAEPLGLSPYDVALRLGAELPRVLAMLPERASDPVSAAPFRETFREDPAVALQRACFAAGVDTVVFDERDMVDDRKRFMARKLELRDDALVIEGADRRALTVAWSSVHLVLRAMQRRLQPRHARLPAERGAARAIFEMRVIPAREARSAPVPDLEAAMLVYARGAPPVVLREGVDFGFLGDAMRSTRFENLQTLRDALRERAIGAHFDDRLLRLGAREQAIGAGSRSQLDLMAHALDLASRAGLLQGG